VRSWIVAGIVGGIVMFIWSTIVHVATPLGMIGLSPIPKEAAVLTAMHDSMGDKPGLYFFPWVDPKSKDMMTETAAKMKVNPSGLVIYHPPGRGIEMMPKTLITEFAKQTICTLLVAFLLAQTMIAGYAARVGFVSLIGLAAGITTNVSYWNWYGFPTDYTLAYAFMNITEYVAAGFAIAAVLRRPAS
jgi:hypothetical protein